VEPADVVKRAIAAIGEDRPDDYVLAPHEHAGALADKAPALASLLRSSKMEGLAEQYKQHDEEAGNAQSRFKRAMTRANGAVLATAVLAALIMVGGIFEPRLGVTLMRPPLLVLGLSALLAGALASMWLFRVREGHLLDEWMTERAHAETARLAYFTTLVKEPEQTTSDPPLALLKLEYVRRYLLDMQIAYYGRRGRQHRRSADRTLTIGGFAAALGAVAAGSAGLVASFNAPWASLAAVGVVGTALAAFAATREAVNQDRRNAERYGRTLSALKILRGRLDDVRAGVLAGLQDVLEEYVAAVQEQLSLEHREWLAGAESTRSAIGKLDETLAALPKGKPGPEGAG
jgi:SMODS and SLOG-associating 2TM effector domain 1